MSAAFDEATFDYAGACPYCGKALEAGTGVFGAKVNDLRDDGTAFMVCFTCARPALYTKKGLRRLDKSELEACLRSGQMLLTIGGAVIMGMIKGLMEAGIGDTQG